MVNKLKKNWKTILIALLVLFSLNKCTVSCNRQGVIDKQTIELVQKDSIIVAKQDTIKAKQETIEKMMLIIEGKNNVTDAHLDNKEFYEYKVNKLQDSIKVLNKEKSKLTNELKRKNGEISNLNIKINKLEVEIHELKNSTNN
jgi:chromosome segregation ATPase